MSNDFLPYRLLIVGVAVLLATAGAASAQYDFDLGEIEIPAGDECSYCHVDLEELPPDFSPFDVHFIEQLSCVGCHGGDESSFDEEVAMSEEAGFIGVPEPEDIPALCGKCHSDQAFMRTFQPSIRTDQESQYYNSGHGMALLEGDTKVATCTSCHSAHAILPASDPRANVHDLSVPQTCNFCHGDDDYMAPYRLERNVFEKYSESVHGVALLEERDTGSPACNDCHGNHGALPPEVNSLAEVCGTCHPNNQRLFEQSPMAGPFGESGFHACIECHGHHGIDEPTDEMVGVSDEAICMDCHGEGERAYEVADSMHLELTELVALTDSAKSMRQKVARIGMDDVEIEFLLLDAHQSLVQARTLVHSFDASRVAEETDNGLANAREAIELAINQIKDHRNRRFGFGIAAFFATLLLIALYLKLREIERDSPTNKVSQDS